MDRTWKWNDSNDVCEYFTMPAGATPESVTDTNLLLRVAPEYYGPKFDAIAEQRKQDDGTLYKGQGFRKIATLVNTPAMKLATILNPGFTKDKREFYRWLDSGDNWRYCTYDRRKQNLSKQLTFQDGKPIT